MNKPSLWNDSQIHAFVDGELDAAAAAQLQADSHADTVLAARIARQRELRTLLRGAFDPVLDEPVPERLSAAASGPGTRATVTPIGAARSATASKQPPRTWGKWGAVAATLLLGILLGAMAFRTPASLPFEITQGQLLARGELDTALSTQLSGAAAPAATTQVGLTFRAADGAWCRTFSQPASSGIACRSAGHWTVRLLEGGRSDAAAEYRQAGSSLSPAMLGAITTLGGGDALDAGQERQQLSAGWE